ncbi:MAG: NnrS family protein [Vicinamibacterales bacterium]
MSTAVASHTFAVAAARDNARATLLRAFLASGLMFMIGPGTLLGVVNLLQISGRESVALISPAWTQAHGHALVFGWVGSFMLGIGIYSVPSTNLRARALQVGWATWALWTAGVALRWTTNVYEWQWRVLFPLSAVAELAAFVLFLHVVSSHRPAAPTAGVPSPRAWLVVVITGVVAWLTTLLLNVGIAVELARHAGDPSVSHVFNQRVLVLLTWGILAPFIWGFTARWMPVLLGLPPLRVWALFGAVAANVVGIVSVFAGFLGLGTTLAVGAAVLAVIGLRLFERPIAEARIRGVHVRFPTFVRLAYAWLLVAAGLGAAAAHWDVAGGLWGASRHAFTVGFVAAMVLAVGQRMLPGFAAHRPLWSPSFMGLGLTLLMLGCVLRVSSEILAYEQYAEWAWFVLPLSGGIELAALGIFAINLYRTLWLSHPGLDDPLVSVAS